MCVDSDTGFMILPLSTPMVDLNKTIKMLTVFSEVLK